MTTDELYNELNFVNSSREKRLKYANLVLGQPELIPILMDILFMFNDKISIKAAWVLNLCAAKNWKKSPYLDVFTENLHKVHLDSAERPMAKVCELLANHIIQKKNAIQNLLNSNHKEKIIEAGFDWMITDVKVAPKAYAMVTLYLFGKDYDWIHPELATILEQDFQNQSAGYKARARHILRKIRK